MECYGEYLILDEWRCEVVCTNCGLVSAGTGLNVDYSLGFLLERPSWRYHTNKINLR